MKQKTNLKAYSGRIYQTINKNSTIESVHSQMLGRIDRKQLCERSLCCIHFSCCYNFYVWLVHYIFLIFFHTAQHADTQLSIQYTKHNVSRFICRFFFNFYFVWRLARALCPLSIIYPYTLNNLIFFPSKIFSASPQIQFKNDRVTRRSFGLSYFEMVTKWVQMASSTSSSWSLPFYLSANRDAHYIFKFLFTAHTLIDINNPNMRYWWLIVK